MTAKAILVVSGNVRGEKLQPKRKIVTKSKNPVGLQALFCYQYQYYELVYV